MRYRWRLYLAHGRHQFRLGVWRLRRDRMDPEYRYVALEWQL